MNRRHFLQLATATAATTALPAQTTAASLSLSHTALATVPLDFNGLSYESPQLANPAFFSPANTALVKLFRDLAPTGGVLRTGGNISAFTLWRDDPSVPITSAEQAVMDKGKRYWEWDLTDPTVRHGNHEAIFTPVSIETLAGFLKATGWRVLYGLNFANGTPEQAAAEAACVQRLCGSSLLAFQLGNEIEYWSGGFRPKPWDFDAYYTQWKQWVKIIRKTVPNAPFGGPDVASNLKWVESLAENEGKNITVLTKHHYAMGPAGDPRMDAHHLLGPDPEVAKEIASAQRAKSFAGVGFRNAESGSCYHGGQPGVSNAFASALWAADYLLTLAQGGHAGVNLHGGGDGYYSPITGDPSRGFTAQPAYFGMKLAQQFAGATILESSLSAGNANLTAYAARSHEGSNDKLLIALINKDSTPITLTLPPATLTKALTTKSTPTPRALWKLSAPALDTLAGGVTFAQTPVEAHLTRTPKSDTVQIPACTALVLHYA